MYEIELADGEQGSEQVLPRRLEGP